MLPNKPMSPSRRVQSATTDALLAERVTMPEEVVLRVIFFLLAMVVAIANGGVQRVDCRDKNREVSREAPRLDEVGG